MFMIMTTAGDELPAANEGDGLITTTEGNYLRVEVLSATDTGTFMNMVILLEITVLANKWACGTYIPITVTYVWYIWDRAAVQGINLTIHQIYSLNCCAISVTEGKINNITDSHENFSWKHEYQKCPPPPPPCMRFCGTIKVTKSGLCHIERTNFTNPRMHLFHIPQWIINF